MDKDKSVLVRAALDRLEEELEKENLRKSASLYGEVYPEDAELKEVTAVAPASWPE